jgi:hypothetical protein
MRAKEKEKHTSQVRFSVVRFLVTVVVVVTA